MSKVVYLRHDAPVSERYVIEPQGTNSWWVRCQAVAWDGTPVPADRVVFFARSEAEARAWVDARVPTARPAAEAVG
ncbi:hypothetical protein [Motiliproteus sediminis]|uniref:hypothetical protein n=1 Tax=Motiliproteus sediminis TaxID=1468178 RepID=UPI001AEF959F|nr:hypothetical protein [Motiliproteus sediminis]